MYLNLRKASVIRVMAILPNSRPSTGWRRGYLTNELHKRDLRCRSTKLRYSRTATIKLWWQHLGAQLPGTLPQPLNDRRHQEQCSRHKSIRTIPRYPRDPKFFSVKFEERRVKISTSGGLTRATKGLRSKRILLSDIYNPKTQNIFSRLNNASDSIKQGAPKSGWLWLPTCNTHDAAISPTSRSTT